MNFDVLKKDCFTKQDFPFHQVNTEQGCQTFNLADLPWDPPHHQDSTREKNGPTSGSETSGSSNPVTSEVSLGDYLPGGTMIPAASLRLLTRHGPAGMQVVCHPPRRQCQMSGRRSTEVGGGRRRSVEVRGGRERSGEVGERPGEAGERPGTTGGGQRRPQGGRGGQRLGRA